MEYFLNTTTKTKRMNTFYQKGSKYEPEFKFNASSGEMCITGISMPENTVKTYMKLLEWLSEYKKNPAKNTILSFDLEYINTASSKMIHEILRIIDDIYTAGQNVQILWYYHGDDSDILEIGEEFKDFVKTEFILKKK